MVVVGVATSLLSSYLKAWFDDIGGRISKSWAQRNDKRGKERRERIERFVINVEARQDAMFEVTCYHSEALEELLLGISLMALGVLLFDLRGVRVFHPMWVDIAMIYFAAIMGLVSFLLGVNDQINATRLRSEITEARKLREGSTNQPPTSAT